MSFLVLIIVLAIEEYWSTPLPKRLVAKLEQYGDWLGGRFNGGQPHQGLFAWGMGVLLPAVAVGAAGLLLGWLADILEWIWAGAVLYFCLGFKQANSQAGRVSSALRAGDLPAAKEELKSMRAGSVEALNEEGVAKLALEETLRAGFAGLLGVIFWFVLLGPFGAVLFRATHVLHGHWHANIPERGEFLSYVDRLRQLLDWLPVRALAFSFAIAGNFQGAMECWRNQAWQWWERNEGVLLASGAGALGVRIGGAIALPNGDIERAELGTGATADADYLDGATALIWRVTLFWLAILFLMKLGELAA